MRRLGSVTIVERPVPSGPGAPLPAAGRLRDDLLARARAAGADRLPDEVERPSGVAWLYATGDFEAAALARVVAEGHETNRFVDYALNFAEPGRSARFTATATKDLESFALVSPGRVTVLLDDEPRVTGAGGTIDVGAVPAGTRIEIRVDVEAPEPPTVGVRTTAAAALAWAGTDGRPVGARPGGDQPPHRHGEAEVVVPMQRIGADVFALPAPMLGRIVMHADREPAVTTGESLEEALSDPSYGESRWAVDAVSGEQYLTRHQLGFQFARISGATVREVAVRAAIRPAPRRGAFVTDDPELNAVWATSAYTLRLCMQTFLIDGIKRDRMPWIGDHALGVLTNAYAFADGGIVRDTLTALGRPRHGYINGISDYSLWWVISHGLYQRYSDDAAHIERESTHIDAFLADLATHAGADGVFRPALLPDSFAEAGPGSLFLDWGVTLRPDRDATAIQVLWHWALRSGAQVLAKAGHRGAERWDALADRVRNTLIERAWSTRDGHWREYLDHDGEPTAYPNFLAALSGLEPNAPFDPDHLAEVVASTATGTPFMRALALIGMARLGRRAEAVREVKRLWGRMLNTGALTFWEEFGDTGASPYEMYRRPYGKSLCHAWSAGPAAVLPQVVLGLVPVEDGWREFTVDPRLGDLAWAGAVVPTPHGDIVVLADRERTVVEVPVGATLVDAADRHAGPLRVELPAADPV